MITEAEIGVLWPQAKDVNSHQELEEARTLHKERGPAHTLILASVMDGGPLASGTEKVNPCCVKPPSLWPLVRADKGNQFNSQHSMPIPRHYAKALYDDELI